MSLRRAASWFLLVTTWRRATVCALPAAAPCQRNNSEQAGRSHVDFSKPRFFRFFPRGRAVLRYRAQRVVSDVRPQLMQRWGIC